MGLVEQFAFERPERVDFVLQAPQGVEGDQPLLPMSRRRAQFLLATCEQSSRSAPGSSGVVGRRNAGDHVLRHIAPSSACLDG